jgi:FkbM family methyltransferase
MGFGREVSPLPTPALVDWVRLSLRHRRIPRSTRKRARWRAMWQFEKVAASLSPPEIAIDCGASGGDATRRLAANGATVYAFEPDPHGFGALLPMFKGAANVHLRNQAVGIDSRRIALYRTPHFADDPDRQVTASSVYASNTFVSPNSIEVEQIDLVGFIGSLPQGVAILKMDIEGAEVPVLERLLDTGLIYRIGYVFAETHAHIIPELAERTKVLRERIVAERLRHVTLDWV